jgi:streptogramin lyase
VLLLYLLRLDGDGLDAVHFRRLAGDARALAADGDAAEADRRYREALALWRGPPLADVQFESFARNEVERLDEERVAAVMDRIDCDLALGGHDAVVPELEALVRQYPLRERLRAQLMLALYRSGRQADALAAYLDARQTLVDELGLEPGTELHALEQRILNHDPTLAAPRRSPKERRTHARRRSMLVGAVVAISAAAVSLAFGLREDERPSAQLDPMSVSFIDARSDVPTVSFPVGRRPRAVLVFQGSVWVANRGDGTVMRIDPETGSRVTIPIAGHPVALAAFRERIWATTIEGLLVPIDPRFDSTGEAIDLGAGTPGGIPLEEVVGGAGSLWIMAPPTTVIRLDPARPEDRAAIIPDFGAATAIDFKDGVAWVAGSGHVLSIPAATEIPGPGIDVGPIRDLTFAHGSIWIVSGGPAHRGLVQPRLRRLDPRTGLLEATIRVGDEPIEVAASADRVWVGSGSDGMVYAVDPEQNRVVASIHVEARPMALAAERDGVWVAVT